MLISTVAEAGAATDRPPYLCHHADPRAPGASSRPWWLCRAHANHVKRIAEKLHAADVPHLVPLGRRERVKPNRTRVVTEVPLFDGYLFLTGEDEFARHEAMAAAPGRLHLFIPVYDRSALVSDLSGLMDALESGAPIGGSRQHQPGDAVVVTSGPLEGLSGVLVREKGRDLLLLHVRALGQVAEVEVERWRVEPVD